MTDKSFSGYFSLQLLQQFTFAQDPGQDTEQRTHGPFIELLQFSASLFENAARPVHAASASAKHLQLLFVIGDGRIDRGEHAAAWALSCAYSCSWPRGKAHKRTEEFDYHATLFAKESSYLYRSALRMQTDRSAAG